MKLLHRFQSGTRTYLLLTGIGAAACAAAPFIAAYVAFKPSADSERYRLQNEFFNKLNSSIAYASAQLQESLKGFDLSNFDPTDPFGSEKWKKQHRQEHDMTDEEWYFKNSN